MGGTTVNGVPIINRGAILGFHANGYAGITEDGFKMMKAAFDWVLEPTSRVEENDGTRPENYILEQIPASN